MFWLPVISLTSSATLSPCCFSDMLAPCPTCQTQLVRIQLDHMYLFNTEGVQNRACWSLWEHNVRQSFLYRRTSHRFDINYVSYENLRPSKSKAYPVENFNRHILGNTNLEFFINSCFYLLSRILLGSHFMPGTILRTGNVAKSMKMLLNPQSSLWVRQVDKQL